MRRFKVKNKAFSLVETVVYVGVFSMVMSVISALAFTIYKSGYFASSAQEALHSARKSLETITNSIREASFADNGAYPVEQMAPYEFVFYSDIDNDRKVERLRIFLDGTTLKMEKIKSSGMPPVYESKNAEIKPIALHIRNREQSVPIFEYSDKDAAQIQDLSKVLDLRRVTVRIIVDKDPNRPPEPYSFRADASLRNIINVYEAW